MEIKINPNLNIFIFLYFRQLTSSFWTVIGSVMFFFDVIGYCDFLSFLSGGGDLEMD